LEKKEGGREGGREEGRKEGRSHLISKFIFRDDFFFSIFCIFKVKKIFEFSAWSQTYNPPVLSLLRVRITAKGPPRPENIY
jgi:hypothetical protein